MQGYAWWYLDALSDDGQFGLTMIAFVGSVFSPYYKKSGRNDPENHCALNVALYGPRAARWVMNEKSARHIHRSRNEFTIGKSSLNWGDDTLTISVHENTAPFNRSLSGTIKVYTHGLGKHAFYIDNSGRHRWRPLSPSCRIELDFKSPSLKWAGAGYLDSNDGDEPLEDAFRFWDWSRTTLDRDRTAILYNTDTMHGPSRLSAMLVDKYGDITDFETPPAVRLPSTPIFRIKRRTRSESGAKIIQTLEDTPFYSRSIIRTELFGKKRRAIHESLVGPRLNSPIVQFMLPYRMPRIE
ncbi:MAG: hypothetical protein AAGA69_06825 [Pseudomonadota bacterium]